MTPDKKTGLNPESLGWNDRGIASTKRRQSFNVWVDNNFDDLLSGASLMGVLGCGLFLFGFAALILYGLYKLINYLFG